MTTITRERLEWLSNISGRDDIEDIGGDEIRELARIALASLEKEDSSEPVAFINGAWTLVYYRPPKELGLKIGDKLFTAPPAPVVSGEYGDAYQGAREDLAIWKRRALEAEKEVQRLSDINDYLVKEAQGEARMGEPVIHEPAPVVLVVPEEKRDEDGNTTSEFDHGWNACRAAMLQGNQPVSNRDEFLPGIKPAPELDSVAKNADSMPGNSPSKCSLRDGIETIRSSGIPVDVDKIQSELQVGNSPVIPDRWIPVSERVPESNGVYFGWDGKRVLEVNCFFGGFTANQFIHGEITHWMPLPEAPQQEGK